MSEALQWHDEADILGVHVRAHFFDPQVADAQRDAAARLLPVLVEGRGNEPLPRLLGGEGARALCRVGGLQAWPDAVFEHGAGLICVSYRRHRDDERPHELLLSGWVHQLRVDAMLSSIAAAMAVAGQHGRPTAVLWRGFNVLYQFDPGSVVLECLATNIEPARRELKLKGAVEPDQLASFCEPRLRALPGLEPDAVQQAETFFGDFD